MTGPRDGSALYAHGAAPGAVSAGPRSEPLHAARVGTGAQDGPAHSELPHVDEAGTRPQDGPAHREAQYRAELERMAADRDQLAADVAAGRPVDVAGTIRAQLAQAYRAAAGLEAAQLLEGAGTGRPRGLAGLQRADVAVLDVDEPAGPRGLSGLLAGLEPPASLQDRPSLPPAAAQLLAHVTRARTGPELAVDARAALHARPQLPQDGPELERRPLFTVSPALAGLIGPDRPRVIADAVRRHALADRARLVARISAQATAAARLELQREHAQEPPSSTGLTCTDAANPQVATPSGSPTIRRRDPDPTPTNRRQDAPSTPETSAQDGRPARTGLSPLGVPELAALIDASRWSAEITARALATLPEPAPDVDDAPACPRGHACPGTPCQDRPVCETVAAYRPPGRVSAPDDVDDARPELTPGPCSACHAGCTLPAGPCCPHDGCDPQRIDDEDVPLCPVHDAPPDRAEPEPGPCLDCRTSCPVIGGPCTPQERPHDLEHGTPRPTSPAQPPEADTRAPGRPQDGAQELEACPVRPWAQCVPGELKPAECRAECARLVDVLTGRARELTQDGPQLPGEALPAPTGPTQAGPRPHTCGRPDACRLEPPQEPPTMATEHHAPRCLGPHPLGTLCHGYRPQDVDERPAWVAATAAALGVDPVRALAALPQDAPQEAPPVPDHTGHGPDGITGPGGRWHIGAAPQDAPQHPGALPDQEPPQERPHEAPQELAGLPVLTHPAIPPNVAALIARAGRQDTPGPVLPVSRAQLVDLGLLDPTPEERAHLEAVRAAYEAAQDAADAPVRQWDAIRARQRAHSLASRPQTARTDRPEA